MSEELTGRDPFLCIDVSKLFDMPKLARRFDDLFPERTIRLIVDGEYSPYFYHGAKKKWVYKSPKIITPGLECKVVLGESIYDFITSEHILLFELLKIPLDDFKIVRDVNLFLREYPGMFFSNGDYHFFDQFLMLEAKEFVGFISDRFQCKIIMDTTSSDCDGIMVIQAPIKELGEKYD